MTNTSTATFALAASPRPMIVTVCRLRASHTA
jgi:hypothetical protein